MSIVVMSCSTLNTNKESEPVARLQMQAISIEQMMTPDDDCTYAVSEGTWLNITPKFDWYDSELNRLEDIININGMNFITSTNSIWENLNTKLYTDVFNMSTNSIWIAINTNESNFNFSTNSIWENLNTKLDITLFDYSTNSIWDVLNEQLDDAPIDGLLYGRRNSEWEQ
jgi:hypothetical protein